MKDDQDVHETVSRGYGVGLGAQSPGTGYYGTLRQSMEHSPYGLSVTLPVPFDTAVAGATAALKAEGFGVLTTIDVQHTLKTKLNRDFLKYVILGACNPALADRALHASDGRTLLAMGSADASNDSTVRTAAQ